jgi:hypothetical protein
VTKVQQDQRNCHRVDDRTGEQILRAIRHQPVVDVALYALVQLAHFTREFHALAANRESHLCFAVANRNPQFVFEQRDLLLQLVNSRVHTGSP